MGKRTSKERRVVRVSRRALARWQEAEHLAVAQREEIARLEETITDLQRAKAQLHTEIAEVRDDRDAYLRDIRTLRGVMAEERHHTKLTGDRNAKLEEQAERAHVALVDLLLKGRDAAENALDAQRQQELTSARAHARGEGPVVASQNGTPPR